VLDTYLNGLPASALRSLLISEIRKFIFALEFSSSTAELNELRAYIKSIAMFLAQKEEVEFTQILGKYFPQNDQSPEMIKEIAK